MTIAVGIALCILGVVLGVVLAQRLSPAPRGEQAEDARQHLLDAARTEAEQIKRDAQVESKELLLRAQETAEAELRARREEIERESQRLGKQEAAQTRKAEILASREEEQSRRDRNIQNREQAAEQTAKRAEDIAEQAAKRLEQIAGLSVEQARAKLADEVREDARRQAAIDVKRIEEEYRLQAEERAKTIIGTAVQRYASEYVAEKTVSVVPLPSDDMKGRIIGRDGRNIRAFEAAAGVTVLVDDTPNAVVLSGFDPVRREAARIAMERLVMDGRIHPARIEEVLAGVNQEMDALILKTGEEAVYRAALAPMHPEVVRLLGKLHFRHSFSQNVLQHSVEVAHLCGLMASEMGEDPAVARRAGLLHDIGKAMTHEVEGPHALVGADFLKRHGEGPVIINAVASHHEEVPHENIFGILVAAADAISASRPGSRSESMTTYLQRLQNLEQIAMDHPGVEKAFAVQAGRELRVVVRPEQVDDQTSLKLARDIARRVEDELLYPGQIRVTVIRETRCVEFAK